MSIYERHAPWSLFQDQVGSVHLKRGWQIGRIYSLSRIHPPDITWNADNVRKVYFMYFDTLLTLSGTRFPRLSLASKALET